MLFEGLIVKKYGTPEEIQLHDRVKYLERGNPFARPDIAGVSDLWTPNKGVVVVILDFFERRRGERYRQMNGWVLVNGGDRYFVYKGKLVPDPQWALEMDQLLNSSGRREPLAEQVVKVQRPWQALSRIAKTPRFP